MEYKTIYLECIKHMFAHWGEILKVGNFYKAEFVGDKKLTGIIDSEKYYKTLFSERFEYFTDELDEFTKVFSIPHIKVKGDDDQNYYFITLTKEELYSLGISKPYLNKRLFTTTVYYIDDYFNYIPTRREERLNKLLK